MKKKRRKKKRVEQALGMRHSLVLSIAAHLTVLALLVAAAWWYMPAERPGAALFVDDVVVDGGSNGGSTVSADSAKQPIRKAEKTVNAPTADAGADTESRNDGNSGTGAGDAGDGGTNSGSGSGGNGSPVLAEIIRRIERSKRYPEQARLMHQEGVIGLRFVIQENGHPAQITVMRSSNSSILDDAAKSAIERSAPLPHYPKPIELTLRFHLH